MREIAKKTKNNTELRCKVKARHGGYVVKLCKELLDRAKKTVMTKEQEESILKECEEYGKLL